MEIIEGELVDTLVKIGGDISTISVNGELQEVIKGNVDIKVPTKITDLEIDKDFVEKEQADNDYANKQVTEQSLTTANEKITNVENGLNVANRKITALENDNETLHTNIETLSNGLEESDGKITSLQNDLDTHKTQSSQAFEDLGASIQELEGNVATAQETADQAKAIAEGKATGYVFDTYGDMVSWVASHSSELKLGDHLYIRALDVPDYWWDGTSTQPLETQKVDLSDYYTKGQVDDKFEPVNNNIETLTTGLQETDNKVTTLENDIDELKVLKLDVDPTTKTEGKVGQFALNITSSGLFQCVSVDEEGGVYTYTWVAVGGGGIPIRRL